MSLLIAGRISPSLVSNCSLSQTIYLRKASLHIKAIIINLDYCKSLETLDVIRPKIDPRLTATEQGDSVLFEQH